MLKTILDQDIPQTEKIQRASGLISSEAKQILIDSSVRYPRSQIVLGTTGFYLWNPVTRIKTQIEDSIITELQNVGVLDNYQTGGIYINSFGMDAVDLFLEKRTKTNHHGKTESYYEYGARYGTTDCGDRKE